MLKIMSWKINIPFLAAIFSVGHKRHHKLRLCVVSTCSVQTFDSDFVSRDPIKYRGGLEKNMGKINCRTWHPRIAQSGEGRLDVYLILFYRITMQCFFLAS